MSLPGSTIKKILDALISGFPTEEKLKELLHLNLNITGATYPDGVDYENRVFKLLDNLDAEARIIELIEVAYRQNNGNSNLQRLYRQIPKINLLNIIFPFEKQNFQKMKQSYNDCYLISDFSDWEPKTIEEILDVLDNSREKQGYHRPTIQFVDILINRRFFPDVNEQLREWRTQNIVSSPILNPVTNQYSENYLIILVSPSQQYKNERFIVKAWIVFDIKHDDLNSPSIEKYQSLNITSKSQEPFLFKDICGYLLKDLINQAICKLKNLNLPIIELFLPYGLLNEPIDALIPNSEEEVSDDEDDLELPIPIGVKYKVHIRSYQRIKKLLSLHGEQSDEKIIFWQRKWRILQENYTKLCVDLFLAGETNDDVLGIVSKLNSENSEIKIGLKLLNLPSKEILKAIDATGTPIALWLRHNLESLNAKDEENSNIKQEFDQVLDSSIRDLSDRIKNTRSFALRNKDHIGNHISLLLDNPYILPPEALPYTQP
jgi:hypothetical protein